MAYYLCNLGSSGGSGARRPPLASIKIAVLLLSRASMLTTERVIATRNSCKLLSSSTQPGEGYGVIARSARNDKLEGFYDPGKSSCHANNCVHIRKRLVSSSNITEAIV